MPTIQIQLGITLNDDTAKSLADILGPALRGTCVFAFPNTRQPPSSTSTRLRLGLSDACFRWSADISGPLENDWRAIENHPI